MALNSSARGSGATGRKKPARLVPNRDLVALRLNKGWMPNDLARVARIHGNTVRAAEQGFYIDARSQFAIAQALGVQVLDLFPFERQKESQR